MSMPNLAPKTTAIFSWDEKGGCLAGGDTPYPSPGDRTRDPGLMLERDGSHLRSSGGCLSAAGAGSSCRGELLPQVWGCQHGGVFWGPLAERPAFCTCSDTPHSQPGLIGWSLCHFLSFAKHRLPLRGHHVRSPRSPACPSAACLGWGTIPVPPSQPASNHLDPHLVSHL